MHATPRRPASPTFEVFFIETVTQARRRSDPMRVASIRPEVIKPMTSIECRRHPDWISHHILTAHGRVSG